MYKKLFVVILAVLPPLSALFISACTGNGQPAGGPIGIEGNQIVVGEFGSMTGNDATFGISTHNGILLALKEINAKGGVKGKTIKLISLDDQGKPDEAATVVQKLITQNRVITVLGEVASTRSLAAAPIAQRNKIPMITPSSTNPKVTEVGDYIFRVCFIDPFQGTVMARFATNNLKIKTVAILTDVSSDYSTGLRQFFKEKFESLGGKVVSDQNYAHNDIDFKAQLTAIKSTKPDAIFIPGYYTEVGLIALQARGLGIKVPLLGGDGWDSDELYKIGKEAVNGAYFSNHYTTDSKDPKARDFRTAFKKEFQMEPDGLSAMGYDAAYVMADAMGRAKTLTPSGIRDALSETKNFPAITGNLTIDAARNTTKSAVIVQVKGEKNIFVTTIAP